MNILDEDLLNLDTSINFGDGGGNDYQWHVLLLVDLIFRKGYKELPYNKLAFRSIKKFGRNNLSKRIRELKKTCRGEMCSAGRDLDLYVHGDPKCFEDVNILHKKEGNPENHIYIQVKGTKGKRSNCTPHYVDIFKNFFKNCNFSSERSAFFIIMNFKINNALKDILCEIRNNKFSSNSIEFILKVITNEKSFSPKLIKLVNSYIIGCLSGHHMSENDVLYLTEKLGITFEDYIIRILDIVKKTYFIEHLSFLEIEDLLETSYGSEYLRAIDIAKRLSSRKSIKNLSESENTIYLKYNSTYFQELITHNSETCIEDGGFFNII